MPVDVIYNYAGDDSNPITPCDQYVQYLGECMIRAHAIDNRFLGSNTGRSKEVFETNIVCNNFIKDDLVSCVHKSRHVCVFQNSSICIKSLML